MPPKERPFRRTPQSLSNGSRSQTSNRGRALLSEGVLAAAEGPCLVVEEFQQLNTSPKSEQYPSTAAGTPPLRRFRPQQLLSRPPAPFPSRPRRRGGGVGGAAAPYVCDFFFSRNLTGGRIHQPIVSKTLF